MSRPSVGSVLELIPDEILLQVFSHLVDIGPSLGDEDDPWYIRSLPFRNNDRDEQPHPGIRAYPFLGQVCRKWKNLLATPIAQKQLWGRVVVDFGHELVTSIHTPLAWSNERPSADEYMTAYAQTTLSANKIIDFMLQRQMTIRSFTLCNSEGFWGEEGEYLSLNGKHNFRASHLGLLMGSLKNQLEELKLFNCNDLISSDQGLWGIAALCPNLRTLAVENINCRVSGQELAELSRLSQLEHLSIIVEERTASGQQWIVGMDLIPPAWAALSSLTSLELRGHQLLDVIPPWLKDLPSLRMLDLSNNPAIQLDGLPCLTQLEVLVLQRLDLSQPHAGEQVISPHAKRFLPNLEPLGKRLRALSLSHNHFTRLPDCLIKLTAIETLDFSGNKDLQLETPLTAILSSMPHVAVLDFRAVHKEKGFSYWSDAKCTTMKHLAAASKLLKRRKYPHRVIVD
eukprot:gene5104-34904_t